MAVFVQMTQEYSEGFVEVDETKTAAKTSLKKRFFSAKSLLSDANKD